MKTLILLSLSTILSPTSFAQLQKMVQRDWIKESIEDLSGREMVPDTLYTRYSFSKSSLNISFYPGWNDYTQTWSVKGSNLSLGFDTYRIEVINDTALTIALDGFRRIRLLSEQYLSSKEKYLDSIGQYRDKSLFRANNYITPRYNGHEAFRNYLYNGLEGYGIVDPSYFLVSFIVTAEGKVENVVIRQGIAEGFDASVIKKLLKISGDWIPAKFDGTPIQTEMFFDIKHLGSMKPGHPRVLN